MILPTVCRFVWYRPGPNDCVPSEHRIPQIDESDDRPLSGQICGVLGPERVNLAVMGADGSGPYPRQNVKLVQDGPVQPGECTWMPFQKGQSAKVDETTEKLKALLEQSNSAKLIPGGEPEKNTPAETTQNTGEVADQNPAPAAAPAEQTQAQGEQAPQG